MRARQWFTARLKPCPDESKSCHTDSESPGLLKKQLILSAFEQSGGSITETAKLLGLNPNYLHRLIRNLDLRLALRKDAKV